MAQFYRAVVESTLCFSITVWYGSTTEKEKQLLESIVRTASKVAGCDFPSGNVSLKVYVACCGIVGEHEGQCEEILAYTITQKPGSSALNLVPQNVVMVGRSRLMLYLMLQCDKDYYGEMCDVKCHVDFPAVEHALCNVTTGQRQCEAGWEGTECQKDTDECSLNYCQNGARCVNTPPGSFTCNCKLGTQGLKNTPPAYEARYEHDQFGFFQFVWEPWYTAVVVTGGVLVILIIVICCLMRRRVFKTGIRAKGSFYSVFINTKTFNKDEYDNDSDEADDTISGADNSDRYHNVPRPRKNISTRKTAGVEKRKKAGGGGSAARVRRGEVANSYISHLPTPQGSPKEEGQYIDLINPSFSEIPFSDYERLPNLVQPHQSPYMVHRTPTQQSCTDPRRGLTLGHPSLAVAPLSRSGNLSVPQVVFTHQYEPFSPLCDSPMSSTGGSSSPKFSSGAYESPILQSGVSNSQTSQREASGSPSTSKALFRSSGEVFTIGGTLSSADESSACGTPRPRPRKSLMRLAAIHGKKMPSEPRLKSIRRVDSSGYEVPVKLYEPRSTQDNPYTTLKRARAEEHVYDKIRSVEEGRREEEASSPPDLEPAPPPTVSPNPGVLSSDSASPVIGLNKSLLFVENRVSVSSDVHRYFEIDINHFGPGSCRGSDTPPLGTYDRLNREDRQVTQEESSSKPNLSAGYGKLGNEARQGKANENVKRNDDENDPQNRDQNSPKSCDIKLTALQTTEQEAPNTTSVRDQEYLRDSGLDPDFEHDKRSDLAGESDNDTYQDCFGTDSDDDFVWSDFENNDVFTDNNASV
ncbi:uncharacterized protein [Littorina saxatilis]|uniref:uncharacterized protein n=1 Tax=Littorina saxatilis TaxID=31220 RepID=UPI0038B59679